MFARFAFVKDDHCTESVLKTSCTDQKYLTERISETCIDHFNSTDIMLSS